MRARFTPMAPIQSMSTARSDADAGGCAVHPSDPAEPGHYTRLGISLSGGGIRSATFSLGVYQRLSEAGLFERARYLSAVSGGSYLAAGLAISHALSPEHLQRSAPRPWARGSPEEVRLRRNLSYLAPEGTGRAWLFTNLLYGVLLNLTPLILAAFVSGRIAGVGLDALYPGLSASQDVDLAALPWVLATIAWLVLGAVIVVGRRRFRDKDRSRRQLRTSRSERIVMLLLGAAAIVALFGLVLPGVVDVLTRITAGNLAANLGLGSVPLFVQRSVIGLIAVLIALCIGGIALWLLRRHQLSAFRGILAGLSGAGILIAPFILAAETVTVRGWSLRTDVPLCAGAVGIILIFAIFAHNRRYSMHLFYRERIQEAFASRRYDEGGAVRVAPVPYDEPILLSEIARRNADRAAMAGPSFPELIMCAAVAARGAEVPSKTWAASFTFEGRTSGNERLNLQAATPDIEEGDWIGGGDLTLPSMMAISGAAISPLMGRFTLPAFRFLMAIMNIRLGVWIRNPARRDAPTTAKRGMVRRGCAYIVRGWREPGAWYVLKEGLGLVDAQGRYIYVSDGGHWENLGLTELLRRRCTHIVVVDASGDRGLGDIGRAMAIARAELGVEVRLDPRATMPDEGKRAESPYAVGTFTYEDGLEGDIFYARSVLWEGAPSDLHLFADREALFPNHPTSNQFLSGELFDAYRALGWAVGDELASDLVLPQERFDEPRREWSASGDTGSERRWGAASR